MKHTGTEWHFLQQGKQIQGDGGHEVIAIIREIPVAICELPEEGFYSAEEDGYRVTKSESVANGKLIAAAPKMYAMLKGLYSGGIVHHPDVKAILDEVEA